MRETGIAWFSTVSAAAEFHLSVVETNRRELNSPVPDSARKESTSPLVTWDCGS